MVAKCSRCGTNMPPKNKFCPNCGQPVYAAPAATQGGSEVTETSTPHSSLPDLSSQLGAAFWLGLIGAIVGLLIGAVLLAFSTLTFVETGATGIGVVIFSILGIIAPLRIIDKADIINGGLMFVAGIGVLICVRQLGIFSALLFFIGGALIVLKKG